MKMVDQRMHELADPLLHHKETIQKIEEKISYYKVGTERMSLGEKGRKLIEMAVIEEDIAAMSPNLVKQESLDYFFEFNSDRVFQAIL